MHLLHFWNNLYFILGEKWIKLEPRPECQTLQDYMIRFLFSEPRSLLSLSYQPLFFADTPSGGGGLQTLSHLDITKKTKNLMFFFAFLVLVQIIQPKVVRRRIFFLCLSSLRRTWRGWFVSLKRRRLHFQHYLPV